MKIKVIGFLGAVLMAGCATVPARGDFSQLQGLSSSTLWAMQATTSSPLDLAMIEAELGSRGETSGAAGYLGQKTASAYGRKLYQRTAAADEATAGNATATGGAGGATSDQKNCSDFASGAEAQKYFIASGGPVSDPNHLDGDGDGLACDWGKQIVRVHKRHTAKPKAPVAVPAYRSSSRCHVGPRGGRYTIGADGSKNYGGC